MKTTITLMALVLLQTFASHSSWAGGVEWAFRKVELVGLTMAKASSDYIAEKALVITNRTRWVGHYPDSGDGGEIYEVAIRTFENNSYKAVRIYQIYVDASGGMTKAVLTRHEGPVGP